MTLLDDLALAYRALRECDDAGALFARAAALVTAGTGFDRCVVATVTDGELSAFASSPLADEPSDALRRRLVATPLGLRPGTVESELLRHGRRTAGRRRRSDLADVLELRCWACSPVVPEEQPLALVVVDRAGPVVGEAELEVLDAWATMLGPAIEHFVLRRRAAELAEEVRQFAGSAHALAREVLDAPVALPTDRGRGPTLRAPALAGRPADDELLALLSPRERRIAELLVEGRSNREIAEVLVVSPETIKTHVARILRKVGASNRVEAVSRLLRLSS